MILRVKKQFDFNGLRFFEGQIIKLGTSDYKKVKDNVEMADKFTKEVAVVKDKVVKTKVIRKK